MSASKPTRPRAGFGLSSAINTEQMKTRNVAAPKSGKAASVKSARPARPRDTDKRTPPPKR